MCEILTELQLSESVKAVRPTGKAANPAISRRLSRQIVELVKSDTDLPNLQLAINFHKTAHI